MTMHQKIFAVIATLAAISLVVIVALAPRIAHAQGAPPCGPTVQILKQLEAKFGETPLGAGLTDGNNNLFTVLVSEKGTWTILFSTPDGRSCIGGAGTDWMASKAKVRGLDS
jgi:hypothetical protein